MKLHLTLKELMKQADINATNLSKACGVPLSTLHGYLNEVEPKGLTHIKNLADFFDVSVDFLCFGEKDNHKEKISEYADEINAGVFEVVLRRIKK